MMESRDKKDRNVRIKDLIEVYKDPETETQVEGYAYVWEIMEEGDTFFTLIVSFAGDPHQRKVPRKYRKSPAEEKISSD